MNLLIILITAILANAVPIIRDLPHEPNIPPNGDSNLSEDVLHRTSNPSEIHERFYRASDPNLDTHVSNLKAVARITNGIYLIQGITSGTIDSDELISEILRFGPVKPSDISAIDMSKVGSAIDDMKKLSEKLVATVEVGKVENVLNVLKSVLNEVDGIGNLSEWTNEKEYFKSEIGRLAKDGLDLTDIDSLDTAYKTWKPLYKQLSEKKPATSADDIENVKKSLQNLKTATSNLRNPASIWQFTNFTFAADGIAPILKAEHGVDIFLAQSQYMSIQDSHRQVYTAYSKPIPGILNDLIARLGDIQLVSKLGTSRREVKKRQLRHTFGLSDSSSDLSSISSDLADSWIKKVIKTEQIKTALKQLEGLAVLSKNVDTSVGGNLGGIDDLVAILKSLDDVSKEVTASESGVSLRFNCAIVTASNIKKESFQDLNNSLSAIDDKLVQLKTATDNLLQYVDTSGVIKLSDEVIAICEKMKTDKSDYQDIWTELGTYNNLKELNGKLEQVYVLLTAINGLLTIKGDAENATKLMDSLDGYHKRLSHYSDYFKCLQDQDQLKLVFKAIDGLNWIRGWKDDTTYSKTLDNGLEVVKKVVDAKSGLEKMKESIKELRELKTPETDAMKDLPEAATHSQVIGKAVQGLSAMAKALKKEDDLKKVVVNIGVVESRKHRKKLKKIDVESLDELVKLSKDITSMFTSLAAFTAIVGNFTESETLGQQSDIFAYAKPVSGVTGDFSGMIRAVEELKKITNGTDLKSVKELEDGLKVLESLDLDFIGFHESFDLTWSTLKRLDEFLESVRRKFAPITTTTTIASQFLSGIEDQSTTMNGKPAESQSLLLYILIPIVTAVIVTVIVFIIVWRCKLLCFKQKWTVCPVLDFDEDDHDVTPLTIDLLVIKVVRMTFGAAHLKFLSWRVLLSEVKSENRDENRPFPYKKLDENKYHRRTIPLEPMTSLQVVRLHGNVINTRLNDKYLVLQSPTSKSDEHADTREEFFSLILKEDIQYVMVVGTASSVDAYCEEMVGGVFTIGGDYRCETLLSEPFSATVTDVNIKRLRITLSNKGKVIATRTVCQINFPNWTDDVWPTTYDTLYDIHNLVTSSPKPIIVHSTTGIGPVMGLVGLRFCSQLMEIREDYTFDVVFRKLIKRRYCSFNDAQCIGWLEVGVMYFLTRKHRLETFMFNNNNQMFQNMVTNGEGIPEELRGTRWD